MEQRGDEFWGLSPFKDEKTPSFSVRPNPPCFYDYSSGIGGNVFTFVRYYFHCNASEAVRKLREYAGDDGTEAPRPGKLDATRSFLRYRQETPRKKEPSSVILPEDYMSRYEKREDKLDVWKSEGISDSAIEKFQVFYDGFSNRLVYPIRNVSGKIVNVGGRTLDPDWKEKKQRKYTYFFSWGTMDTVYGLSENMDEIKKKREIIIFEGAKSVMLAYGWGIQNCGAILTSHLNQNQMKILAKLGCRVVFALDKDVDITADRNIRKLSQYVSVDYIKDTQNVLGDKESPVDRGEEVFRKLYEQRIHYH